MIPTLNRTVFGFLIIIFSSSTLLADNRLYVWTYEYKTMEKGVAEVEHYLTFKSPFADSLKGTMTTVFNLELEIGMTDRFDFSIYQNFEQQPGDVVVYKGYKLRSRYRLGEKGHFLMDPLLYFEYKGKPDFSEHGLEGKLILAKDIGRLNIAINPVMEYEYKGKDWEPELKYNAGVSYAINDLLRIGMEVKGGENGHYLGPVIAHGRDDLWVVLGSAFKLTTIQAGEPEIMLRMIVGVGL